MIVEPTANMRALNRAREQSKVTTAPKKSRPDAIDPSGEPRKAFGIERETQPDNALAAITAQ